MDTDKMLARQANADMPQARPPAPSPCRNDQSIVLVVDDEFGIRKLVSLVLRKYDYMVREAETADEAIVILRELAAAGELALRPCVVLLDIMMPGTDGLTVLRDIKTEFGVPVIMCSGLAAADSVQKARLAGADDYLVKPFELHALVDKIAQAVCKES